MYSVFLDICFIQTPGLSLAHIGFTIYPGKPLIDRDISTNN